MSGDPPVDVLPRARHLAHQAQRDAGGVVGDHLRPVVADPGRRRGRRQAVLERGAHLGQVDPGVRDHAEVGGLDPPEAVLAAQLDAPAEVPCRRSPSARARTRRRRGRPAPRPPARRTLPAAPAPGCAGARAGSRRCRPAGRTGFHAGSECAPARPVSPCSTASASARSSSAKAPSRSSVTRFTAASPIQAWHRSAPLSAASSAP